ncbi:MAG TPA: DUF934 domain-containing protein [Caulobacteraceae bacterium]|jgi:uncharacterized protein (DUF934 family)
MSQLIRLEDGRFYAADDRFTLVADDEPVPEGDVIVSLNRFQAEGEALASACRLVGVRLEPHEAVEDLAYDLPTIPVVALNFAKFRDGRPYTSARLLRERFGYAGEVRAMGDVLREQALFMVRCGFDSFVPADDSSSQQWTEATRRYRHVYQRAADVREPAFEERALAGVGDDHGL